MPLTAVTLRVTAVAFARISGLVRVRVVAWFVDSGVWGAPIPVLVSSNRTGLTVGNVNPGVVPTGVTGLAATALIPISNPATATAAVTRLLSANLGIVMVFRIFAPSWMGGTGCLDEK